jgi:hypothetical protein
VFQKPEHPAQRFTSKVAGSHLNFVAGFPSKLTTAIGGAAVGA